MPLPPQAIVRDYTVLSNRSIADGVFELMLAPANLANGIPEPKSGQWVMLHLLNADGSVWGKSAYSLASPASEVIRTGNVRLAIRVAGDFTSRAKTLTPGNAVKLQGPFGVFTLARSDGSTPVHRMFFAGGIGVTPLRSLMLESLERDPEIPVTMVISVKTKAEAAFFEEFRELAGTRPNVSVLPFFTRETGPVEGECGRITEEVMKRILGNTDGVDAYVCGPRPFMEGICRMLESVGVDRKRIHMERFN